MAVLAMLLPTLAGANDLLRAYDDARDQDPTLQAAFYQRAAAAEARPQALAALMPQLSAEGSLDRAREGYEVQPAGNGSTTGAGAGARLEHFYGNTEDYGLSLSQTLWSLESFRRLGQAGITVAQAEARYRSAQQALILRVAQAYFGILSAQDTLRTNQREREAFGELLHQAQVRRHAGVGPQTDVAEAQSFYDATGPGVIDAQDALDDARAALAQIAGHEVGEIAALRDQIPLTLPAPDRLADWLDAARQDNFDVRAAELKADAAWRGIGAERARRWPTLSLQGSAQGAYQPDDFGGRNDEGRIGLQLDWPIYQGGLVASQVRQAQAEYLQARSQWEAAARQAEREARAAFRGVSSGVARIKAGERAVDSGSKAVQASRRGLDFGTRTEFDLLNAQNDYYAAQRTYFQSRYDYLQAVLTLKQQAGRLQVEDLAAIDALLVARADAAGDPATDAPGDAPHVP